MHEWNEEMYSCYDGRYAKHVLLFQPTTRLNDCAMHSHDDTPHYGNFFDFHSTTNHDKPCP